MITFGEKSVFFSIEMNVSELLAFQVCEFLCCARIYVIFLYCRGGSTFVNCCR